ncbi:MAG: M23 family metallopeptidase, partial [Bacteroidota bacterium]
QYSRQENGAPVFLTSFKSGLKYDILLPVNTNTEIIGLLVKPAKEVKDNKLVTQASLALPFKGKWYTFWGGTREEDNYHVVDRAQKHAFDFVIRDENANKSFSGTGTKNEDYYAFGKDILSASDGEVIMVVDGIYDNKPGLMNPIYTPGNTVVIKAAENEYHFYAHFKKNTISVKEGQRVKQGELLGKCGNSGNSSEPHLHFHIQDTPYMQDGEGIKSIFKQILVNSAEKVDYSPIRGDIVSNKN